MPTTTEDDLVDFGMTRTVEIHVDDIINCLDAQGYEVFLDLLSKLHSNTEMLMDINWEEIQPMKLQVSGDVSEAVQYEEFL